MIEEEIQFELDQAISKLRKIEKCLEECPSLLEFAHGHVTLGDTNVVGDDISDRCQLARIKIQHAQNNIDEIISDVTGAINHLI